MPFHGLITYYRNISKNSLSYIKVRGCVNQCFGWAECDLKPEDLERDLIQAVRGIWITIAFIFVCGILHIKEMGDKVEKVSKKELEEVLEREVLYLETLRKLQGLASRVVTRSESLKKLADDMRLCETDIIKRYFFPIDKTIESLATLPASDRGEMIKTSEEDKAKIQLFIDALNNEVTGKEEEIKEFKEATKLLLERLTG